MSFMPHRPLTTRAHVSQLRPAARDAAALMRAMGNPQRLLLLCELSQHESSVSELALRTGIRQPTLSQQLAVLRDQDLVFGRREGKQVHYSVAEPRALAVLKLLYRLYCKGK